MPSKPETCSTDAGQHSPQRPPASAALSIAGAWGAPFFLLSKLLKGSGDLCSCSG